MVDMYERRFLSELRKLPKFVQPDTKYDGRVWRAGFPAWRALFSSMLMYGHATGHRLPSSGEFFSYCKTAWTTAHPQKERFTRYFEPPLEEKMRQRVGVWYESGMAETHLYACLVERIEDRDRAGIVMYDPRCDWKLKMDLLVLVNGKAIRVSAYTGSQEDRSWIEERRYDVERMRKTNTPNSAHWGNAALENGIELAISKETNGETVVNGVRLFSKEAIDGLIERIYAAAGLPQDTENGNDRDNA